MTQEMAELPKRTKAAESGAERVDDEHPLHPIENDDHDANRQSLELEGWQLNTVEIVVDPVDSDSSSQHYIVQVEVDRQEDALQVVSLEAVAPRTPPPITPPPQTPPSQTPPSQSPSSDTPSSQIPLHNEERVTPTSDSALETSLTSSQLEAQNGPRPETREERRMVRYMALIVCSLFVFVTICSFIPLMV